MQEIREIKKKQVSILFDLLKCVNFIEIWPRLSGVDEKLLNSAKKVEIKWTSTEVKIMFHPLKTFHVLAHWNSLFQVSFDEISRFHVWNSVLQYVTHALLFDLNLKHLDSIE